MEEADSGVAVVVVFVEVASMAVTAACPRRGVAARMSDRVHVAASGLTRTLDPEPCGAAFGTVQAEQLFRRGHRASLTLTVVGALLRGPAMAPDRRLRLPAFDPELMEARGNRSGQIVRLFLGVRQGAPLCQERWK